MNRLGYNGGYIKDRKAKKPRGYEDVNVKAFIYINGGLWHDGYFYRKDPNHKAPESWARRMNK